MHVSRAVIPGPFFPHTPRLLSVAGFILAAALIGLAPAQTTLSIILLATGLLLALRAPWLAWLALAALLPVAASWRIAGVSPADLLLAGAVFLWAIHAIAQRRWEARPRLPLWTIWLYLLALLFASTAATDLAEAAAEVIKWAQFGVLLWVVPIVTPARYAPWLVAALLIAAVAQGALGLYQFVFRIGPEWFAIQERFMRASGVFRQPNPYAGYLGLTLPVALSLTLWSLAHQWGRHRQPGAIVVAGALLIATAMIGAGLLASWSRGGWLGAVAGVTVALIFLQRRVLLAGVLAAFSFGVLALLAVANPSWIPGFIRSRLADLPTFVGLGNVLGTPITDENFAVQERLAHWVAALRMWEGSLWQGIGPGNYNQAYGAVALPLWPNPLGHAHNIYLNVLAESGLIGFVTFVLLWIVLIAWVMARLRALPFSDWRRALAAGTLGVLAHLAVHSIFDNLFVQGIYLHLAFWLAVLATALPRESDDPA